MAWLGIFENEPEVLVHDIVNLTHLLIQLRSFIDNERRRVSDDKNLFVILYGDKAEREADYFYGFIERAVNASNKMKEKATKLKDDERTVLKKVKNGKIDNGYVATTLHHDIVIVKELEKEYTEIYSLCDELRERLLDHAEKHAHEMVKKKSQYIHKHEDIIFHILLREKKDIEREIRHLSTLRKKLDTPNFIDR